MTQAYSAVRLSSAAPPPVSTPSACATPAAAAFARGAFDARLQRHRVNVDQRVTAAYTVAHDMPHVAHPRLTGILLPELAIDPVSELRSFVEEEHAVSGGSVLDSSHMPIVWPWQQQHGVGAPVMSHNLDRLINLGLDAASADGARGRKTTGVKAWFAFCADERVAPHRPLDPVSPLYVKLTEEWLAMRFCCALVEERGVAVDTASQYFSTVQGWHAREHGVKLAGGLKLERLPQMLKGLRRTFGSLPPKIRRGLAPQALRKAMDICLPSDDPANANLRAALTVAFIGLLRGEEFAIDGGAVWRTADRMTRADIAELTIERLVIMMRPCKNMKVLKGKSVPLVLGAGGVFLDPVAEVTNMLKVDPAHGLAPADVPLFRDPASNSCITKQAVHNLVKHLMLVVGENPTHFGTHSLRIGGATSLFAQGADPTVIRTMGRWSSDIYRLYVRACFERCCEWTRRAGSAIVTDVVVDYDEVEHY